MGQAVATFASTWLVEVVPRALEDVAFADHLVDLVHQWGDVARQLTTLVELEVAEALGDLLVAEVLHAVGNAAHEPVVGADHAAHFLRLVLAVGAALHVCHQLGQLGLHALSHAHLVTHLDPSWIGRVALHCQDQLVCCAVVDTGLRVSGQGHLRHGQGRVGQGADLLGPIHGNLVGWATAEFHAVVVHGLEHGVHPASADRAVQCVEELGTGERVTVYELTAEAGSGVRVGSAEVGQDGGRQALADTVKRVVSEVCDAASSHDDGRHTESGGVVLCQGGSDCLDVLQQLPALAAVQGHVRSACLDLGAGFSEALFQIGEAALELGSDRWIGRLAWATALGDALRRGGEVDACTNRAARVAAARVVGDAFCGLRVEDLALTGGAVREGGDATGQLVAARGHDLTGHIRGHAWGQGLAGIEHISEWLVGQRAIHVAVEVSTEVALPHALVLDDAVDDIGRAGLRLTECVVDLGTVRTFVEARRLAAKALGHGLADVVPELGDEVTVPGGEGSAHGHVGDVSHGAVFAIVEALGSAAQLGAEVTEGGACFQQRAVRGGGWGTCDGSRVALHEQVAVARLGHAFAAQGNETLEHGAHVFSTSATDVHLPLQAGNGWATFKRRSKVNAVRLEWRWQDALGHVDAVLQFLQDRNQVGVREGGGVGLELEQVEHGVSQLLCGHASDFEGGLAVHLDIRQRELARAQSAANEVSQQGALLLHAVVKRLLHEVAQ